MLNSQQKDAVKYLDGPLLVLAGAGSGKTRVITKKIEYLICSCEYKASSIVAVTFTNKAASEMRARIGQTLSKEHRRGLNVLTFHTLGLRIIRRHLKLTGLNPGFSIFDSEDCAQIIRNNLPSGKAGDKEFVGQVQQQISRWKNDLIVPDDLTLHGVDTPWGAVAFEIYPKYQMALKTYNAVDFDDLILRALQLLQQEDSVLTYWQNKIRYLLVDEYQDSNTVQYLLVKLLTGMRSNFTVVGDDDQSIYAWRGAKPENLSQLQKDYPNLKVIKLEQNYRSTGRILHAANHLIAYNPHLFDKKLWSELGFGSLLRVVRCKDEHDEAEQVVLDLISHKMRTQSCFGDYAILYRGNHQSRPFEKALRHYSVPYRQSGGQSWFAKSEVKDIFAYLRLLCNPNDDAAFLRIINTPKRGIGDASIEALASVAKQRSHSLYSVMDGFALSEHVGEKQRNTLVSFKSWLEGIKYQLSQNFSQNLLKQMVEESGYESYIYEQSDTPAKAQKKMDNVWELIDWVSRLQSKKPGKTLSDVVNQLILIDILEQSDDKNEPMVQLLTLHASKGLEYPHVYLVGMEEELLPHRVSIDEGQIEEERRLAYVGITRAQKELCFTLAKQRKRGGELSDCAPSRFLEELPGDCLEWLGKDVIRSEEQSKNLAKSHLLGLKNLLES